MKGILGMLQLTNLREIVQEHSLMRPRDRENDSMYDFIGCQSTKNKNLSNMFWTHDESKRKELDSVMVFLVP
ncbi:hypothetical protein CLU79DRAFT_23960 [Phycomyces nitens]|nr:hypothetical protein CLU79DRAFT_23960 [Phycomyces nitens]